MLPSVEAAQGSNPWSGPFLDFLARDMANHPERRPGLPQNALNERLRNDWITDVAAGVERWNRVPAKLGIPFRFKLPHKGFHRKIGVFNDVHVSPDGRMLSEATWTHHHQEWLPNEIDRAYVQSLMGRVTEAGQFANWIAPPAVGINRQPVNFDYIRFN